MTSKSASYRLSAVRRFILAVVAAGLCSALAPAAQATCGDWLAHPAPANSGDGKASATPAGDAPSVVANSPRRAPCDGPLCKQAPDSPTPPSPVEISLRPEKLISLGAMLAVDPAGDGFGRYFEQSARPAKGHSLRIEHPPRA